MQCTHTNSVCVCVSVPVPPAAGLGSSSRPCSSPRSAWRTSWPACSSRPSLSAARRSRSSSPPSACCTLESKKCLRLHGAAWRRVRLAFCTPFCCLLLLWAGAAVSPSQHGGQGFDSLQVLQRMLVRLIGNSILSVRMGVRWDGNWHVLCSWRFILKSVYSHVGVFRFTSCVYFLLSVTCVSLSAPPLIILTCVPPPQWINSPRLSLLDHRCLSRLVWSCSCQCVQSFSVFSSSLRLSFVPALRVNFLSPTWTPFVWLLFIV